MANSYTNWQFASENVQTEITNGEYVSSESTLILGGPARLSQLQTAEGAPGIAAQTSMFPIGLVDSINVQQNKGVQRLFEIGSKRAYFVPGRLIATMNISRVLFFGPSLLRMLYAVAPVADIGNGYGQPFQVNGQNAATPPAYAAMYGATAGARRVVSAPGYGATSAAEQNRDFYINLSSELFSIPVGLCIILKDPKNNPYGAMYLEDVYISSHGFGISANNIIIAESVSAEFNQVAPVQLISPPSTGA